MAVSRRQFLRSTGLAAAFLGLPAWLGACARDTGAQAAVQATAAALAPDAWADQPAGQHPEIAHLLGRITFGPRPGEIERAAALGWETLLEQQLHPEQLDDSALERRLEQYPTLRMSSAELLDTYPPGGRPGPQRIAQELEHASLLRAVASERQLLEVMVDFWSSHLSIYIGKGQVRWFKTADDREVIRAHALGRFSDMLLASARSPAMLVYLDNAQNAAPAAGARGRLGINENYARELLELHTVGVDGGYAQDDVVALAHVLTGWTVARGEGAGRGSFVFAPRLHDSGAKRIPFLDLDLPAGGGAEEGEMVLRRLAEHPKTAGRIAAKLAAAFVSDSPPPALVRRVAQTFLDSGTDIRATLGALLRSDEFRAATGQKVKLPLRALVSAARALGAQVEEPQALARQLRALGQPFFGWPAPDGYPQAGAAWANTGGMLARWNLAFALAEGRVRGVTADLRRFAGADLAALVDAAGAGLLGAPLPAPARAALLDYARGRRPAAALSGVVGLVLASPAFQIH